MVKAPNRASATIGIITRIFLVVELVPEGASIAVNEPVYVLTKSKNDKRIDSSLQILSDLGLNSSK